MLICKSPAKRDIPGGPGTPSRSTIRIRSLRAGEVDPIRDVFAGLSARSRYLRFHSVTPRLTPLMLRRLSAVAPGQHVALVASVGGRDVGIARWVRESGVGSVADVGICVVDACQRRGIASVLIDALAASAGDAGIESLTFSVHHENHAMLRLLGRYDATVVSADDCYEVHVPVAAITPAAVAVRA